MFDTQSPPEMTALTIKDGEYASFVPVVPINPTVFRFYDQTQGGDGVRYLQWDPQPDITTHELSQCLPMFFAWQTIDSQYAELPAEARRHWRAGSSPAGTAGSADSGVSE